MKPPSSARSRFPRLWHGAGVAATLLALLLAVLLLGRQVLFTGPYNPTEPLPPAGIIDLHCHTAGIGSGDSGCFVSEALRSSIRYRIYLKAFGVTESDLQSRGDAYVLDQLESGLAQSHHVRAAVVLALDGVMDAQGNLDPRRTEILVPNEFVAREVARRPHLLFGASIHPLRHDALARLDWAATNGAVLVKWIPSIMDIDPADSRWIPFYQRLVHHGLPLLTHTGQERSFTQARDDLADPERLRLPLSHGVVIIAAHAGASGQNQGESDFQRLRRLMAEFPNLHADISALTQVNKLGALREVLSAPECRGRLVYGTDFPLIETALVSPWYFPLNLTEPQRKEIAGMTNAWDRDVRLKQALGVPTEVFAAGERLIRRSSVGTGVLAPQFH